MECIINQSDGYGKSELHLTEVSESVVKCRHGAVQDGGLQGRAGSNGPGGPGVRAHSSSPAPPRVLRNRDVKGRSGAPARRAKDESPDWEDAGNQRLDASQGKQQLHAMLP